MAASQLFTQYLKFVQLRLAKVNCSHKPYFMCNSNASLSPSLGVNEMQTLANMSNAKEIFRQVEMNLGSMNRIKYVEMYSHYRAVCFIFDVCFGREYQARFLRVFQYQVTMRADEIAGESAAEQQALNRSVRALTRTSTITVNDNAAGIIVDGFIEAMKRFVFRHIFLFG